MRTLFSGFLAAGLLTTQMAAADPCARPVEKSAFDVAALKSQLMVTALACNAQDKYNTFIAKYRADLMKAEKGLNSYFGRAFGRRARQQHDEYITSLANAQSEAGTKLGVAYCQQKLIMFEQVLTVSGGLNLPTIATTQAVVQPVSLIECPAAGSRTRTAEADTTSRRHR
jgi:hypothetical protein